MKKSMKSFRQAPKAKRKEDKNNDDKVNEINTNLKSKKSSTNPNSPSRLKNFSFRISPKRSSYQKSLRNQETVNSPLRGSLFDLATDSNKQENEDLISSFFPSISDARNTSFDLSLEEIDKKNQSQKGGAGTGMGTNNNNNINTPYSVSPTALPPTHPSTMKSRKPDDVSALNKKKREAFLRNSQRRNQNISKKNFIYGLGGRTRSSSPTPTPILLPSRLESVASSVYSFSASSRGDDEQHHSDYDDDIPYLWSPECLTSDGSVATDEDVENNDMDAKEKGEEEVGDNNCRVSEEEEDQDQIIITKEQSTKQIDEEVNAFPSDPFHEWNPVTETQKNDTAHDSDDEKRSSISTNKEQTQINNIVQIDDTSVSSSIGDSIEPLTKLNILPMSEFLGLNDEQRIEAYKRISETCAETVTEIDEKRTEIFSMGRQVDELSRRVTDMCELREKANAKMKKAKDKIRKLEEIGDEKDKLVMELEAKDSIIEALKVEVDKHVSNGINGNADNIMMAAKVNANDTGSIERNGSSSSVDLLQEVDVSLSEVGTDFDTDSIIRAKELDSDSNHQALEALRKDIDEKDRALKEVTSQRNLLLVEKFKLVKVHEKELKSAEEKVAANETAMINMRYRLQLIDAIKNADSQSIDSVVNKTENVKVNDDVNSKMSGGFGASKVDISSHNEVSNELKTDESHGCSERSVNSKADFDDENNEDKSQNISNEITKEVDVCQSDEHHTVIKEEDSLNNINDMKSEGDSKVSEMSVDNPIYEDNLKSEDISKPRKAMESKSEDTSQAIEALEAKDKNTDVDGSKAHDSALIDKDTNSDHGEGDGAAQISTQVSLLNQNGNITKRSSGDKNVSADLPHVEMAPADAGSSLTELPQSVDGISATINSSLDDHSLMTEHKPLTNEDETGNDQNITADPTDETSLQRKNHTVDMNMPIGTTRASVAMAAARSMKNLTGYGGVPLNVSYLKLQKTEQTQKTEQANSAKKVPSPYTGSLPLWTKSIAMGRVNSPPSEIEKLQSLLREKDVEMKTMEEKYQSEVKNIMKERNELSEHADLLEAQFKTMNAVLRVASQDEDEDGLTLANTENDSDCSVSKKVKKSDSLATNNISVDVTVAANVENIENEVSTLQTENQKLLQRLKELQHQLAETESQRIQEIEKEKENSEYLSIRVAALEKERSDTERLSDILMELEHEQKKNKKFCEQVKKLENDLVEREKLSEKIEELEQQQLDREKLSERIKELEMEQIEKVKLSDRVKELENEIDEVGGLLEETIKSVDEVKQKDVTSSSTDPEEIGKSKKIQSFLAKAVNNRNFSAKFSDDKNLEQMERICMIHQQTVLRQREEVTKLNNILDEKDTQLNELRIQATSNQNQISALETQFIELNQAKEAQNEISFADSNEEDRAASIIKVDKAYITSLDAKAVKDSDKIEELQNQIAVLSSRCDKMKEKIGLEEELRHQIQDLEVKLQARDLIVSNLEKAYDEWDINVTSDETKCNGAILEDSNGFAYNDLSEDEMRSTLLKKDQTIIKLRGEVEAKNDNDAIQNNDILSLQKVKDLQEMQDATILRLHVLLNKLGEEREKNNGSTDDDNDNDNDDALVSKSNLSLIISMSDKLSLLRDYLKVSLHLLECKLSNELESTKSASSDTREVEESINARFELTMESLRETGKLIRKDLDKFVKEVKHQDIKIAVKDGIIENILKAEERLNEKVGVLQSEVDSYKSLSMYSSVNFGVMARFQQCSKLEKELEEKELEIKKLKATIDEYMKDS